MLVTLGFEWKWFERPPSSRPSPPREGETLPASYNFSRLDWWWRFRTATDHSKVCPLLGEWCQAEVRQQVREVVKTNFKHRRCEIFVEHTNKMTKPRQGRHGREMSLLTELENFCAYFLQIFRAYGAENIRTGFGVPT